MDFGSSVPENSVGSGMRTKMQENTHFDRFRLFSPYLPKIAEND